MRLTGGVYVYRTRKPGAVYNLPILSRHFAYVGQTSSFWHRHNQHMGLSPFSAQGQPWSDLDPVCYRLTLPNWKWLRLAVEALLIWALMPVYNVQLNRHNPRRIRRATAAVQRYRRDNGRRPVLLPIRAVVILGALAGVAVFVAGRIGGVW